MHNVVGYHKYLVIFIGLALQATEDLVGLRRDNVASYRWADQRALSSILLTIQRDREMEQAYATAASAMSHLLSKEGGENEYRESGSVLRSVLQSRPVVLGFVVSIMTEKLRDVNDLPLAGRCASQPESIHPGICHALEGILTLYDPSTPLCIAAVVGAFGEKGCKALLGTGETAASLLPWAHRLCLLHVCLADGASEKRRWGWLPAAADSLCSSALQDLTKEDALNNERGSCTISHDTKGKGRAHASTEGGEAAVSRGAAVSELALRQGGVGDGGVKPGVVASMCIDLANFGQKARAEEWGRFLRIRSGLGSNQSCGASVLLPGGGVMLEKGSTWLEAFRFKLHTLREAVMSGSGCKKVGVHQSLSWASCPAVRSAGELVEVPPEVVESALERSPCSEAFVLAVKAALEEDEVRSSNRISGHKRKLSDERTWSVKLKRAFEVCIFGDGLPRGQGLLNLDSLDIGVDVEEGCGIKDDSSKQLGERDGEVSATVIDRASIFLQCIVVEGVRVHDVFVTLLELRDNHEHTYSSEWKPFRLSHAGVDSMVPNLCFQTGCRRATTSRIIESLAEWLADSVSAWTCLERDKARWREEDTAAVVTALTTSASTGRHGIVSSVNTGIQPAGVLLNGEWNCDGRERSQDEVSVDLLDRLMAIGSSVQSSRSGWVEYLSRIASMAETPSFVAYVVACIERSVALGGQAPFAAVLEKQVSMQADGRGLWRLLEQCCASQRAWGGGGMPAVVVIRAARVAIASCREASRSWIVPPNLLGSGCMRLVIDILRAARETVDAAEILSGLLTRLGKGGPTWVADMFAAIASTAAAASSAGELEARDGSKDELRTQAVTWLGRTLSMTAVAPSVRRASAWQPGAITATALARELRRRVPFETKAALLAIAEGVELASVKRGNLAFGRSWGRSLRGNQDDVYQEEGCFEELGDDSIAVLSRTCQAAIESPLVPLPIFSMSPSLRLAKDEHCFKAGTRSSGSRRASGDDKQSTETAWTTAELLLEAFVQSPVAVIRAVRRALHRGNCSHELMLVQRALRVALCTPPDSSNSSDRVGLSTRRADACLLVGHLVEIGVPGWMETRAVMNPPPPHLVEAAEAPLGKPNEGSPSQPLTALRLELWLRSLLRDSDADFCHSAGDPGFIVSFPNVFETSRALARAISRHASAVVTGDAHSSARAGHGSSCFQVQGDSNDGVSLRRVRERGDGLGNGISCNGVARAVEPNCQPIESARRALADRLLGSPAAEELQSWVSSVVKTAARYRRWLPWQGFADELRNLVVLKAWQPLDAGEGGSTPAGSSAAAEAATFAVCELLLAWSREKAALEIIFSSNMCSTVLSAIVAPITGGLRPPLWLDVLRCLLEGSDDATSAWTALDCEDAPQPDRLAVLAAASFWIGSGGPGGIHNDNGGHGLEAWMRWYEAKLVPLIPSSDVGPGRWLIISSAEGGTGVDIKVRSGVGWAARTLSPLSWRDWGRSPLEAAWHVPAGRSLVSEGIDSGPGPPPIVLPPFATWLRAVLRGSGRCTEAVLDGYIRRMAHEVYLPCEFGGASSEMARQWLGALIEAEAVAEDMERERENPIPPATSTLDIAKVQACEGAGCSRTSEARRAAVATFFREELLRFGTRETPAAPIGSPLTWLWPLEAVVSACGRAGPLCSGPRSRPGAISQVHGDHITQCVSPDEPPSALARALSAVPYDLLCGSRRFGANDGHPPPATLRAFVTRSVDLAARALANPPCRHWSVAQRLLLGLGLLYHALARPIGEGARHTEPSQASSTGLATGTPSVGDRMARKGGDCEATVAQAAALTMIDTLVRIALAKDVEMADGLRQQDATTSAVNGRVGRDFGASKSRLPALPSSCRSLLPLDVGSCDDCWRALIDALSGAGAWRAATAFLRYRTASQRTYCLLTPKPSSSAPSIAIILSPSRGKGTNIIDARLKGPVATITNDGVLEADITSREQERQQAKDDATVPKAWSAMKPNETVELSSEGNSRRAPPVSSRAARAARRSGRGRSSL